MGGSIRCSGTTRGMARGSESLRAWYRQHAGLMPQPCFRDATERDYLLAALVGGQIEVLQSLTLNAVFVLDDFSRLQHRHGWVSHREDVG